MIELHNIYPCSVVKTMFFQDLPEVDIYCGDQNCYEVLGMDRKAHFVKSDKMLKELMIQLFWPLAVRIIISSLVKCMSFITI